MVLSRFEDWSVTPVPYDDINELREILFEWLPTR
jgi:hypothetical protein